MRRLVGVIAALLLVALAVAAPPPAAERPSWHAAMVIDQSCSMYNGNDPARNAIVAPAIFSDLSTERDRFEVFPQGGGGPAALDVEQRDALKQYLDALRNQATSSSWFPAFTSAVASVVDRASLHDRGLVVVVYDGDDDTTPELAIRKEVDRLHAVHADAFVIGVGAADRGHALLRAVGPDHYRLVGSGADLLDAFAEILRRTLNARVVPRGNGGATFSVPIPAGVHEAWLVALADGEVRSLRAAEGHPPSGAVGPVRGGGWTVAVDGRGPRGYQVLHLDAPGPGSWTFEADTSAGSVEYLLLPFFDVRLTTTFRSPAVAGAPVAVEVAADGPSPLEKDAKATITVDGKTVELTPAGDGRHWTGEVQPSRPGDLTWETHVTTDAVDASGTGTLKVEKAEGTFDCSAFDGALIPVGGEIDVIVTTIGQGPPLEDAWLEVEGQRVALRDDGVAPDRSPGDHTWTGRVKAPHAGALTVSAWSRMAGVDRSCQGTFDVRDVVQLVARAPAPPTLGPCRPREPDAGAGPEGCREAGCCTGALASIDLTGTTSTGKLSLDVSLTTAPPAGIDVFLAAEPGRAGRLEVGSPKRVALPPGATELPLRLCARRCPAGGHHDPLVTVLLAAPDAYGTGTAGGAATVGGATAEVRLAADVVPSSWWVCWWPYVLAAAIAGLIAFVLAGILLPVRVPWPDGGSDLPSRTTAVTRGELHKDKSAFTWVALREHVRWRFLRSERLRFEGEALEPMPWAREGRLVVELGRFDGVAEARIASFAGALYRAPWQPGLPWSSYGKPGAPEMKPVKPGDPFRRGSLYWFKGDPRVLLVQ